MGISRARPGKQSGVSLVELMIGLALGLGIALAATALLVQILAAYRMQEALARVEDSGRHALDIVSRELRRAGQRDFDQDSGAWVRWPAQLPALEGRDSAGLSAGGGLEAANRQAHHGSDVLDIRFFGSKDGTVQNCAGFAVAAHPAKDSGAGADGVPGRSVFFVARSAGGEPELRCRYLGQSGWATDALVSGVESFQVAYGVDIDGDGMPDDFAAAGRMDKLPVGAHGSAWNRVVAVRFALLVRSAEAVDAGAGDQSFDLFGSAYADQHAGSDPGTRLQRRELSEPNRLRRIFGATVRLRNWPDPLHPDPSQVPSGPAQAVSAAAAHGGQP